MKEKEIANTVRLGYTYTKGILSNVQRRDASGKTQTYSYDHDSFGNLTEITVGDISLAEYVYDPQNGYLLEQSYGNGDSIAYEYHNLGRTTKATWSNGRARSYTYTGDGQVHAITDNNGTTDVADDLVYSYTYDTLGRTVDSQMCRGIQVLLKTHWEYDDANRIQSQSWQVGTTGYKEIYTYDEDDGSLTGITVEGDIQDANLVYDALGYITQYSQTGMADVTYQYDKQGQLIAAHDLGNDLYYTYAYDTAGNIRSVTAHGSVHDSDDYTNTYTYGNSQWQDLLTAFNDEPIAYEGQTYNAASNTVSGNPVSGNPISYFNGNRWNFTWRNGRQLATANMENDTREVDVAYTYDFDGLRTGKTFTIRNYEFVPVHSYVDTVVNPTCTEQGYTLYECGCGYYYVVEVIAALGHNFVVIEEREDAIIRQCTRCLYTYTDEAISVPIDPVVPPVESYSLRSTSTPSEACGATERTLVSTTTESHAYVYASGTLLRETITTTDEDGNVTAETLDFVYDLNGSLFALNYTNGTSATQTYYYITNIQGDVTHLVTTDGTVVAEYGYDAWGRVTAATGTMAEVNPLRYRGYYYDAESDFFYVSSRYYDPAICRFINADEAAYLGVDDTALSYNLLAYCKNNPVNLFDSNGNWSLPNWAKVVIGAAATVAAVAVTVVTGGAAAPVLIGVAASTLTSGAIGYATGGIEGLKNGLADGFMMGGLFALGGSLISAGIKAVKTARQGITIGRGMDKVRRAAGLTDTATYSSDALWKPLKDTYYNGIKRILGSKAANAVSCFCNKVYIKTMRALGAVIYDSGLNGFAQAGQFYGMELEVLAGYANLVQMY